MLSVLVVKIYFFLLGFLMTFLKRYGYGSIGFNFLLAAYVLEWALLIRGWLSSNIESSNGKFLINVERYIKNSLRLVLRKFKFFLKTKNLILSLLVADFCAAGKLLKLKINSF